MELNEIIKNLRERLTIAEQQLQQMEAVPDHLSICRIENCGRVFVDILDFPGAQLPALVGKCPTCLFATIVDAHGTLDMRLNDGDWLRALYIARGLNDIFGGDATWDATEEGTDEDRTFWVYLEEHGAKLMRETRAMPGPTHDALLTAVVDLAGLLHKSTVKAASLLVGDVLIVTDGRPVRIVRIIPKVEQILVTDDEDFTEVFHPEADVTILRRDTLIDWQPEP